MYQFPRHTFKGNNVITPSIPKKKKKNDVPNTPPQDLLSAQLDLEKKETGVYQDVDRGNRSRVSINIRSRMPLLHIIRHSPDNFKVQGRLLLSLCLLTQEK